MRLVYILPPPNPAVGAVAFLLIAGYFIYEWFAGLLAGGIWVPLNPVIYIGSFLFAALTSLLLSGRADVVRGATRLVLRMAAVAVAAGWVLFVLDRSLYGEDRHDAAISYAEWEGLHGGQPPGDDADLRIDPVVLEATRQAGLGLPEPRPGMPRTDRNAVVRAWQRKAAASAHLWREGFMKIHLGHVFWADTTRAVPYLWFRSFLSLPTLQHRYVPSVSRAACETHSCIAGADTGCSAMFSDAEANLGLRCSSTANAS